MNRFISHLLTNLVSITCLATSALGDHNTPSLSNLHADSFKIGVALNPREIRGEDASAALLIEQHFNAITAEDDIKWERIEPTEGNFDWAVADEFVALGERNGAFMIGHTLLWHSQTPD